MNAKLQNMKVLNVKHQPNFDKTDRKSEKITQ